MEDKMKKYKKLLGLLIFCLFGLNILVVTTLADVEIIDNANDQKLIGNNNIVLDSNGNYYVAIYDDTDNDIDLYISEDDGETWSLHKKLLDQSSLDTYSICINSDDEIILSYSFGSSDSYLRTLRYNIDTDTVGSVEFTVSDLGGTNRFPYLTSTVDAYSNIYVIWYNTDDNDLSMKKFNYQLSLWGSDIELRSTSDTCSGISADCDNYNMYVSFIEQDTVRELNMIQHNINTGVNAFIQLETLTDRELWTSIAVKDNYQHIAYETNISDYIGINYTRRLYAVGSTVTENIYNTTENMSYPSISISNDDEIHIVFSGNTVDLSHSGICGKRGSYNSWSGLEYFSYSTSDEISKSDIYYQNFPSGLNGATGFIGCGENTTDDSIVFYDYGILLTDTWDSEYTNCQNEDFLIEFLDGNTMNWNETYRIRLYTEGWAGKKVRIVNTSDTNNPLFTDNWENNEMLIPFTPLSTMGAGSTYQVQITYTLGNFEDPEIVCDFTIQDGSVVFGNWSIWTDKGVYSVGEHPKIHYIIKDSQVGEIKIFDDENRKVYDSGTILGDGSEHFKITNFNLVENKEYLAILYNSTSGNDMDYAIFNTLGKANASETVTEEQEFNILIGIMVSVGLGIGMLMVTKEVIVFPAVTGVMAFALSRPEFGTYQLFPEIVGIGLIVILVLVGFLVWISS